MLKVSPEDLISGQLLWADGSGVPFGYVIESEPGGVPFIRAPQRVQECALVFLGLIEVPGKTYFHVKLLSPCGIIFTWANEIAGHCEIL